MSDTPQQIVIAMLAGFIHDPPDSEYQCGFLGALLVIANEALGIPFTDPVWDAANLLLSGNADAAYEMAAKKRAALQVIEGGRSSSHKDEPS